MVGRQSLLSVVDLRWKGGVYISKCIYIYIYIYIYLDIYMYIFRYIYIHNVGRSKMTREEKMTREANRDYPQVHSQLRRHEKGLKKVHPL